MSYKHKQIMSEFPKYGTQTSNGTQMSGHIPHLLLTFSTVVESSFNLHDQIKLDLTS